MQRKYRLDDLHSCPANEEKIEQLNNQRLNGYDDGFAISWGDFDRYKQVRQVGEGKYSTVYVGMDLLEQKPVIIKALKPVRDRKIIREIKILTILHGAPNVVVLKDVVRANKDSLPLLIFTYSNNNPKGFKHLSNHGTRLYIFKILQEVTSHHIARPLVIHRMVGLISEARRVFRPLLVGLADEADHPVSEKWPKEVELRRLHTLDSQYMTARDVKPGNVVMDNNDANRLMLIDWGLAEFYTKDYEYGVRVASRHYKAPELLLNYGYYTYSLDIWSLGCVLAAMLFKKDPFFHGSDNLDQLGKIIRVLGTHDLWRYVEKYNITTSKDILGKLMKPRRKRPFECFINEDNEYLVDSSAIDLLQKMLVYDHKKRITATEALSHPYLRNFQTSRCDDF